MKINPSLLILFILVPLIHFANARQWTNKEGIKIEAEFIKLSGDQIILLMKGKEYSLLLSSLSKEDQDFAKEEAQLRIERTAAEAKKFMGQELKPGELNTFDWPISETNKKIAKKGYKGWGNNFSTNYSGTWLTEIAELHPIDTIKVLIGLPENFNPDKGCPIFVQWSTTDTKSHIRGAKGYWASCQKKGWMLVSIEGAPDPKSTWSNSVFYAGIKEFFEQLHQKFPSSTEWPVATGGFSGGSKICQWMGGLMHELEGVQIKGYWLGGCNESYHQYALQDLNISKKSFKNIKTYISSGDEDKLVSEDSRKRVEDAAKAAGLEILSETYQGGHRINKEQFEKALDWFLE